MEAQETPRCESCVSHHSSPALSGWLWVVFGVLFLATIYFGFLCVQYEMVLQWIPFVVVGLLTLFLGVVLVAQNVIGEHAFFFLDEKGKFHTHSKLPSTGPWTRQFTVLDARLVGWFRKSVILGSASVNWRIVDARDGKVRVCDRTAKQYELWTQEPEEVLRLITRFVSVEDIIATLDRRERAVDEFGIGIQKLVLWALANKDRARSTHVQRLREQLEDIARSLNASGLLPEERTVRWLDEANARLAAEAEVVRSPTAPTGETSRRTQEKPGEVA